jgi:hypothetical protein
MSTRTTNGIKKSAAGNESRKRVTSFSGDKGGPNVRGTGIAFVASGTITDSGNGLAVFKVGQSIEVLGSPLNSRTFVVQTSAAGSVTVLPGVVQSEDAGATIAIRGVD